MEKEDATSSVLACLERGASVVCGEDSDWRTQVDVDVAADLRKYRSYRGDSIRDLLRALRNKVILLYIFLVTYSNSRKSNSEEKLCIAILF